MTRPRLRDLGILIGSLPPGPYNAITDVPGVRVGHATLHYDEPRIARTGVTVILPRAGHIWNDHAFAACHSFNGNGEMTGIHWIGESGLLTSPIAITNTHQVGAVHEALVRYGHERKLVSRWLLPVVAETFDGWLNDAEAHHLHKEHLFQAIDSAAAGPVAEGCVGGGTGMICHDFKGGVGTASRVVETNSGRFTLGVLVQANHGDRDLFRIDGVPVGREIGFDKVPSPWGKSRPILPATPSSSIIVVIATDAPVLPHQLKRLARRVPIGIGRVGGLGEDSSGDIFVAFSTANSGAAGRDDVGAVQLLPNGQISELFAAVTQVTEEAILNAMVAAETMTGINGNTIYALPHDRLQSVLRKYNRLQTRGER